MIKSKFKACGIQFAIANEQHIPFPGPFQLLMFRSLLHYVHFFLLIMYSYLAIHNNDNSNTSAKTSYMYAENL